MTIIHFPAVKKRKRKRRSEPETEDGEELRETIRIRAKMRVKDAEGRERIFRSTVAEKGDEDAKQ